MKVSKRLDSIPMSGIRKMFDLAGPGSINLGLGEPDLAPPKEAVEGMYKAASEGKNKYGPTAGVPELREAVAKRYSMYGKLESSNIMITPSGSTALLEITQSFLDPGDEILVPSPGFVIYGPQAVLSGGTYKEYKLTDGDFQPDMEHLESLITPKTKMIVVNTPSNPTGGVLSEASRKALLDLAEEKDVGILSDEVYDSFVYEGKHASFIPNLGRAIVVNGFSKMMSVTGWRMGFICAGEEHMQDLIKMQYHVCANPCTPAQHGILAAMPKIQEYVSNAKNIYKHRRDLITKRINEIDGMSLAPPKGAFYAFPSFDMKMPSADLAMELIKNGLICTPGSAFGKYGEGHLRFSYAASDENIEAGMDILAKTVKKIRR